MKTDEQAARPYLTPAVVLLGDMRGCTRGSGMDTAEGQFPLNSQSAVTDHGSVATNPSVTPDQQ